MFTIITGLFDIGRENWDSYKRPIKEYINYFINVLQLKFPMVIFCEEQFVKIASDNRNNIPYDTVIIPTKIDNLYMHRYAHLLHEIQHDPNYGKNHPNRSCPEIAVPMYSLVVNSKLDLLLKGAKYARTEYCMWLDAGYTHGKINLSDINWNPISLLDEKDKISMILLQSMNLMTTTDPTGFSNAYVDIIGGGFIGGYKNTINKIHAIYYDLVHEFLTIHRIKEDDQYYWTFLTARYPELMNLIPGGWYGALDIK
jgi:uncharacterized protein HtrL/YibB-like